MSLGTEIMLGVTPGCCDFEGRHEGKGIPEERTAKHREAKAKKEEMVKQA